MNFASALRYSLVHTATTVGIGATIMFAIGNSHASPAGEWLGAIDVLRRGIGQFPHNLYVLAGVAAVMVVPVRAGLSDARGVSPRPVWAPVREVLTAALAAICAPLLYFFLSSILNSMFADESPGHRFNHIEAMVIGLWAFLTIPVVFATSAFLRRGHARLSCPPAGPSPSRGNSGDTPASN